MSNSKSGPSMTPEGATLYKMIKRCTDPKDPSFKDYGGRGVKVCADWMFGRDGKSKYQTFIMDMGARPSPKHTIDRIDNDGNYEPGNCRWATRREQSRNKSNNVFFTHNGETQILADWALTCGVNESSIRARLKRGWPLDRALTAPVVTVRPCE